MLAIAICLQGLERHAHTSQVRELPRRIESDQFTQRDALNARKLTAEFTPEDFLGFFAAERRDHKTMVSRDA
jgi:hypothetical protein